MNDAFGGPIGYDGYMIVKNPTSIMGVSNFVLLFYEADTKLADDKDQLVHKYSVMKG